MTRKEIVTDLKDTCKYLDERKALFERMIVAQDNEEAGVGNEDAGMDGVNDGVAEDNAAEDDVAEEEEEVGDEEEDMEADN
jgi:hypothetical protein